MSLFALLILLVVAGVVLYAVNAIIPMEASIKRLLNLVVVVVLAIVAVVWLMDFLGVDLHGTRPRLR